MTFTVGTTFDSFEDAQERIESFARASGFATRIRSSETRILANTSRNFVIQCYRAGIYKTPTTPMKRKTSIQQMRMSIFY